MADQDRHGEAVGARGDGHGPTRHRTDEVTAVLSGRMRWTRRISLRLMVIALVPVVGLSVFAVDETFGKREAAAEAQAVEDEVAELAGLVELRFRLSSAQVPVLAMVYGPRLGIPVEFIGQLFGTDLRQALDDTAAAVNEVVATNPTDPDFVFAASRLREVIARVDAPDDGFDVFRSFAEVIERLDARTNEQAGTIKRQLLGENSSSELREAINQLVLVNSVSLTGGRQLLAFFNSAIPEMGFGDGSLFSSIGPATGAYETFAEQLDDTATGQTAIVWERFADQPGVRAFEEEAALFADGSTPALLTDLESTADTVTSAMSRHSAFLVLIRAAGNDVAAAAHTVRDEAMQDFGYSMAFFAFVTLASAVIVYLVARSIARPLRRLSRYASLVTAGELHGGLPGRAGGPDEVRTVSAVFDEVVENLRAIDAHALALAAGHLDDPVLSRPLPGRLGESLQASVARLSQSIADRDELQRRLAHESTHDGLTGVPNRTAAMFALESAIARNRRRGTAVAVLMVDIDDFKRSNETLGHGAGDEILRETARRLRELARTDDTIARLGGDEFLLIAEAVGSIHDAVDIGERIVEVIGRPMTIDDRLVEIGASVGVAFCVDGHGTGDALVREADLAVYRAKEAGRRRVEVFDTAMRAEVTQHSEMEARLIEALRTDQLTVSYQPVVTSECLSVRGFEALVRWRSPDGTPIPPDAFIPIAETSDLIIDLDRWVIRKATAELARWAGQGLPDDLHLAVNVSGRHLVDRRIVSDVADALADSGLDPTRLVLEITETVLLSDMPVACAHLQQLRDLGVTIALDDFGSGYTSLATLRQLPVDVLKIDRSLVAELGPDKGQSLVRLIIEAAHEFGMGVVAEGVETDEQRSLLEGLGCEQVQGWLVSPAVPADQARALAITLNV